MNSAPPSPLLSPHSDTASRRLRVLSRVARWLFGLLLSVWLLLLASWGLLHGWIVPRIAEFKPLVEAHATRALGVPVRIDSLTAESVGWVPSFALQGVTFSDAQGRPALNLGRVVVALSPHSLLRLGFEQLYIDRPELVVRRSPDGRITVAGLSTEDAPSDDDRAVDWLLDQKELVIRHGSVRWTDELRAAPALELTELDVLMRNSGRRHQLRVDALLPPDWGNEKLTVMAQFRQPLLTLGKSNWRQWDGSLYANAAGVDIAQLRQYLDVGQQVKEGRGALRGWLDVKKGVLTAGTLDMALAEVSARLGEGLEPLTLRSVKGRMSLARLEGGFDFSAEALQFLTRDGRHWPGGTLRLRWWDETPKSSAKAELFADQIDLRAVAQIGAQLPLDAAVHAALLTYAPSGMVEKLTAKWTADSTADGLSSSISAKGRIQDLHIAPGKLPESDSASKDSPKDSSLASPGVQAADVDFEVTPAGGRARVQIQSGSLTLPGIFAQARVPLDKLAADWQWTVSRPTSTSTSASAERIQVQLNRLNITNPDFEGEAQGSWRSGDGAQGAARFPGVLDLQGSLSRGDAAQLHRYLPLMVPQGARDYIHGALQQGQISTARFKVKGDLKDLPFADPKKGEFRASAKLQNVTFAYVPAPDTPQWPALTQLAGELTLDRERLSITGLTGRIDGLSGTQIVRAEVLIPKLEHNLTVQLSADARGPLADALAFVKRSPLNDWTEHALAQATGAGVADYRLKLVLPMAEHEKAKAQGAVVLSGNEWQLSPEIPPFSRVKGAVQFSESGFGLQNLQAAWLGGEIRVDGGTVRGVAKTDPSILLKGQGTVSAEGLRRASELGLLARLANSASGTAAYTATVGVRRGVPEISLSSSLQGLALALPPPLNKSADSTLPFRFDKTLLPSPVGQTPLRLQDQLVVDWGRIGSVQYVRDVSTPQPRVLRGAIGIGLQEGESVALLEDGVAANIRLQSVDLDAWDAALSSAAGIKQSPTAAWSPSAEALSYLPTVLALRAKDLQIGGHRLHEVVSGGGREGLNWRINLDSTELGGYLELRQPQGANLGRVYARLSRLNIPASTQQEVEALLDEQPTSIPALDIVVEEMELRGKRLGRVEIEAVNRAQSGVQNSINVREWRLNKFNVTVPEARFSAVGNWAALGAQATPPGTPQSDRGGRHNPEPRRTALNYTLDISDAGALLNRLGIKDAVGQGKGKLEGQLAWTGSPLALDYPSLSGQFHVNVESGQFLKVPLGGGAKLLGVLSLQSLPRRLALDFRDVFSEGFAFDVVRGDVRIDQGMASTNNLQMKGVSAAVWMEGHADIAKETQDLKVIVVPEINAGTASLVAGVINPLIGLTTFLTQWILRQPLISATTKEFHIDGTWADPRVTAVERRTPDVAKNTPDVANSKP